MAYTDTFIAVSDDCPASTAQKSSCGKEKLTCVEIEYDLLTSEPYSFGHLEFTHSVHAKQKAQSSDTPLTRSEFHSKGQPSMRASALVKHYGSGAHYDARGRIAICGVDSPEYAGFCVDKQVKVLKGMRSRRA